MKGISVYVLEAVIAALMMITILTMVLRSPPVVLQLSTANYKLEVYDGVKIVEEVGNLRKNVLENNATAVEVELDSYITPRFEVAIFNKTTNLTAVPDLDEKNVVTVSYFLAGHIGNYTPKEVKFYLKGLD